jgi:DNA (cytosine-5)-methyltransferase 1
VSTGVIDLFAGPGGWDTGLAMLGRTDVVGIEWDGPACDTARAAGHRRIGPGPDGDVSKLDPATVAREIGWSGEGMIASPPCFVAGTPVITERGVVPIESVIVGDLVLTHMNRWRRVTHMMQRDVERTVSVGVVTATPDHLFYAREQVRKWRTQPTRGYEWSLTDPAWVPAEETHRRLVAVPVVAGEESARKGWRSWWMVGRYLADGWTNDRGEVCIAVGSAKVGDFEARGGDGWRVSRSGASCFRYALADRDGSRWLRNNFGTGAHGKTLPGWALSLPETDRRDLLDGYLSGDGTKTPFGWVANSVSATLATGIRVLASTLGFVTGVTLVRTPDTTVIEGRTVSQSDYWSVRIAKDDGRYTRVAEGHRWSKVRKPPVENGPARVYDITVDEDHSFTAWGVVVHNCQSFSMAGKGSGRADSGLILAGVGQVAAGRHPRGVLARLRHRCSDPRTALVLEPLRWALDLRPGWITLEQVPTVLPLWEAVGEVLRGVGYSVWTGNLQAEMFGVPQTRKRAFLIARLDGPVGRQGPVATHSRFHVRNPQRLDVGVAKWVSMAEALGWGATMRPAMTVTGGGTATGGAEPFGHAARKGLLREVEAGRWQFKGGPMENGAVRDLDQPAPTIRAPRSANMTWLFAGAGATSQVTAGQVPRELDQPAHTITGKGTAAWVYRASNQEHAARRALHAPAPTVNFAQRCNKVEWMPAEIAADPKASGVRVTVEEAAVLQSFPADYPFAGNKGQRYRQVGDACPPLLSAHVLRSVGAGEFASGVEDVAS